MKKLKQQKFSKAARGHLLGRSREDLHPTVWHQSPRLAWVHQNAPRMKFFHRQSCSPLSHGKAVAIPACSHSVKRKEPTVNLAHIWKERWLSREEELGVTCAGLWRLGGELVYEKWVQGGHSGTKTVCANARPRKFKVLEARESYSGDWSLGLYMGWSVEDMRRSKDGGQQKARHSPHAGCGERDVKVVYPRPTEKLTWSQTEGKRSLAPHCIHFSQLKIISLAPCTLIPAVHSKSEQIGHLTIRGTISCCYFCKQVPQNFSFRSSCLQKNVSRRNWPCKTPCTGLRQPSTSHWIQQVAGFTILTLLWIKLFFSSHLPLS